MGYNERVQHVFEHSARFCVVVLIATVLSLPLPTVAQTTEPSVRLLWEAASYTPPLYRGRALPSADTPVRILADARFVTAQGTVVPERSITYTWTINLRVREDLSGVGKSTILLNGPSLFGALIVTVEAWGPNNSFYGTNTIRIPAVQPVLALYNDDPILGVSYRKAIGAGTTLRSDQTTLVAEPYFFNVSSALSPALLYSWYVNDTPVLADDDNPSRITLNVEGGKSGNALVTLALKHSTQQLQTAERSWQIGISSTAASTPFTTQ